MLTVSASIISFGQCFEANNQLRVGVKYFSFAWICVKVIHRCLQNAICYSIFRVHNSNCMAMEHQYENWHDVNPQSSGVTHIPEQITRNAEIEMR